MHGNMNVKQHLIPEAINRSCNKHYWPLQHFQRQLQKGPEADIKNLDFADNVEFRNLKYDVCKALRQKITITSVA
jgi:hypothetical protein